MTLVKCSLKLLLADMGVHFCASDRAVTQQFLYDPQVRPVIEQVRRKRVPERIGIYFDPHSYSDFVNSLLNRGMAQRTQAKRPKQSVILGQRRKVGYSLAIIHGLSCADKSRLCEHTAASVVIDFPAAIPFAFRSALRTNLLWRLLFDENKTGPSVTNISSKSPRRSRGKHKHTSSRLSSHANPAVIKIYVLDAHRAQFSCATASAVKKFNQSSLVLGASSTQNSVELFLRQHFGDVSLHGPHLDHTWRHPLDEAS